MPSFPIQLKRNGTAAATPSSLLHGEVALNYADGKLFWKDASNVIQSFTFQAYALSSHNHAASDVTSGTFDAARIANDSITYAKIQNVSATDRLLGRSSAGSGDVEEITCTSFGRALLDDTSHAAQLTTLGAAPTASPAFTGAATVTNDGNVVPLTVTNTGTANSFVVNDASGDTTPFVIDASGNVGIGLTPLQRLHVGRSGTGIVGRFTDNATQTLDIGITASAGVYLDNPNSGYIDFQIGGASKCQINSSGQLLVTAGSGSAGSYKPGVAVSGDDDTGLQQVGGANTISLVTAGSERVRVGSGGRVQFFANDEKFGVQLNKGSTGNGPFIGSDGADIFTISTSGGAERVRVDAGGNVGIGATPSFRLDVLGSANCVAKIKTSAAGSFGCLQIHNANTNGETSIGFRDDSDSDASSWVIGKSVGGVADAFGFYYNGNRAIIESDGVVKLPDVYEDTVGATNRDLFIDNAGKLGYVSSIRASKANITAIDDVSWLRDLTPVSFHYRKRNDDGTYSDEPDGTLDYGLIAEEVEPVAPEMCFYDVVDGEPQLRGVHYSKLITPMLRYIQQLEARIAALEERNHA